MNRHAGDTVTNSRHTDCVLMGEEDEMQQENNVRAQR
jgi:hypothetical protein